MILSDVRSEYGDAKLTNPPQTLAAGHKARSVGINNRCKTVYEGNDEGP
jgi:hypothetical protein